MECRYRTLKPKGRDPIQDRIVEAREDSQGVAIIVNGQEVARFRHGFDYLELHTPRPEKTGLEVNISSGFLLAK